MRHRAHGTGAQRAAWLQPDRADVCLAVLASVTKRRTLQTITREKGQGPGTLKAPP
jgi:hypothetical protein